MRKKMGRNVGMHSHPRFLNKLPMNEVCEYRRTEDDDHTHTDIHHPERKSNQDVFVCTHSHYLL